MARLFFSVSGERTKRSDGGLEGEALRRHQGTLFRLLARRYRTIGIDSRTPVGRIVPKVADGANSSVPTAGRGWQLSVSLWISSTVRVETPVKDSVCHGRDRLVADGFVFDPTRTLEVWACKAHEPIIWEISLLYFKLSRHFMSVFGVSRHSSPSWHPV